MAGIDRTTVLKGPCIVTYGGQSFWSKGDVTVKPVQTRFPIDTSAFGKVDERMSNRSFTISFEPSGRFTDALAAVLWAVAGKTVGSSILASTDSPLVVHGRDGVKATFHNAGITQAPPIRVAANQTIVGTVEFTAILAKSTDPTDAAAYYTIASEAYPGDTGFAVADIWTSPGTAAWGSSPWDSFSTEAGWEFTFPMQIRPEVSDIYGTYDLVLQSLEVSAKAAPLGPTVANVLTALGYTAALGTSMAGSDDLVVTPAAEGAPQVTVSKAIMVDSECKWSSSAKRIGATEWIATRTITSGSVDPLFAVAEYAAP